MADDYVPSKPGPMPRVPKLLKGPKKRAKKQRPGDRVMEEEAEEDASEAAGTPPFTLAGPSKRKEPLVSRALPSVPSTPRHTPDPAPKADPAIWNLEGGAWGTQAKRQQARDSPARPGSVYCETCFRDDCARWIRIRDGVMLVLRLLGGDAALRELLHLAERAEESEASLTYRQLMEGNSGSSGKSLRSPPPPEFQPSSSEDETESNRKGPKGSLKKLMLLPDADTGRGRPLFHDNPSDVIGLVLLRILAERRLVGPGQIEAKAEVNKIIDAIRQDIGLSTRQFHALVVKCKDLLTSFRDTAEVEVSKKSGSATGKGRFDPDEWWWEFDQALQDAHRQHSAGGEAGSAFATMLAKKAQEAAIGALSRAAAASEVKQIMRLEKALGADVPSSQFLKEIGDELARARWTAQNRTSQASNPDSSTPQPTKGTKRAQDSTNIDADAKATNKPPPAKRRKPQPTTTPQLPSAAQHIDPRILSLPPGTTPLPCLYCAESDASNRAAARRPFPRARDEAKPWVAALVWTFGLEAGAARRTMAEDFFHLVESRGAAPAAATAAARGGPGGLRFLVDTTGGATRVVLVEMRGVFDAICWGPGAAVLDGEEGDGEGEGGWEPRRATEGRKVKFERPVAVWEKWDGGRLEGYTFL
ncbi:hypothetical protein MFIFM68171_08398 [Madurella fahalii]|uniref:Uncharacterized protein n=1 Tax=Madurella fahalii TaxID=1157608 RepID=A0ABQ0GK94_9PEZI